MRKLKQEQVPREILVNDMVNDNFNIIQFNCRSLYTKLVEFKVYLYSRKPHMVCLSETWIVQGKLPNFFNYSAIWNNRVNNRGGGVGILLRNDVVAQQCNLVMHNHSRLEVQSVLIKMVHYDLHVMNIYNPGDNVPINIFNHYFGQLGDHRIIIGDFNAHHRMWSVHGTPNNTSGNSLASIVMNDDNLCLLTPPGLITYVSFTDNHKSTLDLCFISANLTMGATCKRGPDITSDHAPVEVGIIHKPKFFSMKKRPKWNVDEVDWILWREGLPRISYRDDQSVEAINENLVTSIKNSSYTISKTSGQYHPKYSKPWWNTECSRLTAIRRCMKRLFNRHPTEDNYRNWRHAENTAKHYIQETKSKSWQDFATSISSRTKAKTMFEKLRKINNKFTMTPTILVERGQLIYDAKEKANIFMDYFSESFNRQVPNLREHNDMFMQVQAAILEEGLEQYNSPFTKHELVLCIRETRNTSPGCDDIVNIFLKNLPDEYVDYMLRLFNRSWIEETVPNDWKVGLVVPICKPGKCLEDKASYRPITMLSCIGKLIGRLVNKRLQWVLEDRKLLSNTQCGFRPNRSTYEQIVCLENFISRAYKNREIVKVVFVDMKGAFDTVWHNAVLYKLKCLGIHGRMLGWLKSYLSARRFTVLYEGEESAEGVISSGVPQGGILSPLLFNILMSDIAKCPDVHFSEYADDVAIYAINKDVGVLSRVMQRALNTFGNWARKWGLAVSTSKTKAMMFTKTHVDDLILNMDGQPIENVKSHKFLGVTFDGPILSWKQHIDTIVKKCTPFVSVLKITHYKWGSDRKALLTLYNALIQSRIDYCSFIYQNSSQINPNKLNVLQSQCLRIATGGRQTTPIVSLEVEAAVPPLNIRWSYLGMKYYNRILELPEESCLVNVIKQRHTGNTRVKSGIERMQSDMQKCGIDIINYKKTNNVSPMPPWENIEDVIEISYSNVPIKFMTNEMARALFNEIVLTRYEDCVQIYTDGSKGEEGVAAAFVIPERNESYGYRLNENFCIVTAELWAIIKALEYIKNNNDRVRGAVVITDSKSALYLIKNQTPKQYRREVFIAQKLVRDIKQRHSIFLQWIPSHKGIVGNEAADAKAKASLSLDRTALVYMPLNDRLRVLKSRINNYWDMIWQAKIVQTNRGRALRNIKSSIEVWPWAYCNSRRAETALARLRVGHVGLRQHLFRFQMCDTPLCECGEVETIEHFLISCQRFAQSRNNMIKSIRTRVINLPITVKLLLGGEKLQLPKQIYIRNALVRFLHNTGRINEL